MAWAHLQPVMFVARAGAHPVDPGDDYDWHSAACNSGGGVLTLWGMIELPPRELLVELLRAGLAAGFRTLRYERKRGEKPIVRELDIARFLGRLTMTKKAHAAETEAEEATAAGGTEEVAALVKELRTAINGGEWLTALRLAGQLAMVAATLGADLVGPFLQDSPTVAKAQVAFSPAANDELDALGEDLKRAENAPKASVVGATVTPGQIITIVNAIFDLINLFRRK